VPFCVDAPSAGTFKVIHPYGADTFTVDSPQEVRFTEDIGVGHLNFTGALESSVNPFLTWDTGLVTGPDGSQYLGDPLVEHRITGSSFDTNYFRIEGPNIGGEGVNSFETHLFTVTGKIATTSGVDVESATYSRTADGATTLDVFATSESDQAAIEMKAEGLPTTLLRGEATRYFGHATVEGAPPATAIVTNAGDNPPTVKEVPVTDLVHATSAVYDADAESLHVTAVSSDAFSPPALTVEGFGTLTEGAATFENVHVPPRQAIVQSAAGGEDRVPVQVTGTGFAPVSIQAFAGIDQQVQQGSAVTLDGSGSTGDITGYTWTQLSGPNVSLSDANAAITAFTAPMEATTLAFQLTVDGPGGPATDEVSIEVLDVTAPVAAAGADQSQWIGGQVTLDGSASTGASSYSWVQTSGTQVTLSGANTAGPSFTVPDGNGPLVFTLTIEGPGGSATDTVQVDILRDQLTGAAQYRTGKREWRVEGTATAPPPDRVTIRNGAPDGPIIGTADVDALGAWSWREKQSNNAPAANRTLYVTSSRGGSATVQVQVRN
jgi:hypothetical protein